MFKCREFAAEAMHALRKGQGRIFAYGQSNPDVVIVEKAFAYV